MADQQTTSENVKGVLERMRLQSVATGKREGKEVADMWQRIVDCIFHNIAVAGPTMPQAITTPGETSQRFADKLSDTIEINSAIVSSVCALVIADNGNIIGATAPADAMFGYAVGELAGRNADVNELIPHRLREEYALHWRQFWADPKNIGTQFPSGAAGNPIDSVRIQALHANGTEFPIKIGWGHPVFVLNQRVVVVQIMHTPTWQDNNSYAQLGS